jgi:hypothetical protein
MEDRRAINMLGEGFSSRPHLAVNEAGTTRGADSDAFRSRSVQK